MICKLCPRMCNTDRSQKAGYCGQSEKIKIARAALHFGEEPVISGKEGSGTVFFSGCSMKCCFCQNYPISSEGFGKEISAERLSEIFLELQNQGANNINLVSPTHFVPQIISALDKARLNIPVVYNTSGYERVETLRMLEGYIDVYLTDFKYKNREIAEKYSKAPDYYEYAMTALLEMYRQTGKTVVAEGKMKKGVIIRHLVLPGCRRDGMEIFRDISERIPPADVFVSLMSQYTPCYKASDYPEINRRITTFEYKKVVEEAEKLGFDGFMQERTSATLDMTPDFDLTGC